MNQLRLGTRGSPLALAQATTIASQLTAAHPGLDVSIDIIKTTGDAWALSSGPLPAGKGVFTKEIEDALRDARIDLAVHSLKDLPTELPAGLALGAVPLREDPRDCLVSRFGEQLRELPRGSTVGTGSPRRAAQIRRANRGVKVEAVRGNVGTRLKKVAEGQLSAVVVAHAGLRRLGLTDDISEVMPLDVLLPAPGQGFLGLEIRAGDSKIKSLLSPLNDEHAARAAEAERAFLAGLGGGCRVPIAAFAEVVGDRLVLKGLVIAENGKTEFRGERVGPPAQAEVLGRELAHALLAQGAGALLASEAPRG